MKHCESMRTLIAILTLTMIATTASAFSPGFVQTVASAGRAITYQLTTWEGGPGAYEDWKAADGTSNPLGTVQQQSNSVYAGSWSYQSRAVNSSQSDSLKKTVTCVAGTISFWARGYSSSTPTVTLYIGGSPVASLELDATFRQISASVTAGSRAIEIRTTSDQPSNEWSFIEDISIPIPTP